MTRKEEIKQAAHSQFCNDSSIIFGLACEAFEKGAEWADRTMLKKACEWLKLNAVEYLEELHIFGNITYGLDGEQLIEDFCKAMEL